MAKNAYLFFIDDSKSGIDNFTLEEVQLKVGESKADNLFLVLKSRGGSPFSAIAIMNILHTRFAKITTIIPQYAKSAATLMSLGTDEIYMFESSALGPLDLPIEHHRDGSRISALDVQNTPTSMADLVESIAISRYDFLRERGISTYEASRVALENATEFLKPIIEQVDPYHLQKAQRELVIGFRYAKDMLQSRMMKDNPETAKNTAKCLVQDFPAHEFCIYPKDAKEILNLTIKNLDKLAEWDRDLKPKYTRVKNKPYYIEFGILESQDDASLKKQPEEKTKIRHATKR